jgi:phenylalanyl-tRNA synthetase beta chain
MKFTLSWLKEHLDTQAGVAEVAETLTRIGLEVESIEDPSAKLAAFTIAEVLTAERHPQADKLQVLSVNTGQRHHAKGRRHPRRRIARHDVLDARAGIERGA